MRDLENELRKALCRREPPPGFAGRVMDRIPRRRRPMPWMAAIAAVLVLVLAGISVRSVHRQQEQRIAAEKAKSELIYALQVTASRLETARTMLAR